TLTAQSTATSRAQGRDTAGDVSVTGCVERTDQVMPLGGAAIGTTVDSQEFVLIHAQVAGSEAAAPNPSAVGTAGSTAAGGAADGFGAIFRLDGAPGLLNPQVGHRVEVTGSRDGSATPSGGRVDPGNTPRASAPLLRVSSIKTVAETC